MIKILIADDHRIFRQGLVSLLETEQKLKIIGEAKNGYEILDILKQKIPDIILLDIEMPDMNGLEAVRNIRKDYPNVKIIVLTMHKKSSYVKQMMKSGISGYLLKDAGKEELLKAMEAAMSERTYYSQEIMLHVMNGLSGSEKKDSDLSDREIEIIRLIARQMTTREIAVELTLSVHTVETHRKNILLKLGLRNSPGLVRYALQKGLID